MGNFFDDIGGMLFGTKGSTEQVSALNPDQQKLFRALSQQTQGGIGTPAAPLGGEAGDALSRLLSGDPSTEINADLSNQFFESSIAAPARRTFQEQTLPGINRSFSGPGFFGSARARATGRATERFNEGLEGQRASLLFQDEQARRGLAESAAGRQLSALAPGVDEFRRLQQPTSPDTLATAFQLLGIPTTNTIVREPTEGAIGPIAGSVFSAAGTAQGFGKLFCWVAEEIWGVDHPQTWAARTWCATSRGNWFTMRYQRHGIKWAATIRRYPVLRIIVRPIWSVIAMRGRQILNRWRRHGKSSH